MRIGIDMRMAGTGEGIGRYCEELVRHLALVDEKNEYVLIFQDENQAKNFQFSIFNFQKVVVKSRYYSWAEQTRFIRELNRLDLDLMHFTNFNHPIFYRGKFVVTIHDLIHHFFPGKKKSRLVHRLAYRAVMRSASRADRIIAVSRSTAADIERHFAVRKEKIAVVYEGVGGKFFKRASKEQIEAAHRKYRITRPYLLFVGVWRQYKNLPGLAAAFDILNTRLPESLQLVLAGKIDPFYPEIRQAVMGIRSHADIRAPGFVPDEDLRAFYSGASVFVLPSLMEGFGLIGAEAQAAGAPVAASDIPVLREVLGEGAVYFDPRDLGAMTEKLHEILTDKNLAQKMAARGLENARRFDWHRAAEETLKVYQSTL